MNWILFTIADFSLLLTLRYVIDVKLSPIRSALLGVVVLGLQLIVLVTLK